MHTEEADMFAYWPTFWDSSQGLLGDFFDSKGGRTGGVKCEMAAGTVKTFSQKSVTSSGSISSFQELHSNLK